MSVRWFRFCLCSCLVLNKPDLAAVLVLSVIYAMASVAGVLVAGASQQAGCEALFSLVWRKPLCWCSFFQDTVVVNEGKRRSRDLEPADWVRAHQQWSAQWSYGACDCSPRPASIDDPLLLLAEGRPTLFLPACVPNGRQFQLLFGGHDVQVLRLWRSRRPKWFVPSVGEVQSGWKLPRTRSCFFLSVGGPLCKSQGLGCIFLFLLGLVVNCTAPLFY